jgi:hypothetical protein
MPGEGDQLTVKSRCSVGMHLPVRQDVLAECLNRFIATCFEPCRLPPEPDTFERGTSGTDFMKSYWTKIFPIFLLSNSTKRPYL